MQTSNPLWQQRVIDAVDRDVQAKGLQRVQSGGDIALMAVGATRDQQEYQTFYKDLGPRWWWRGFGPEAMTTVQTYTVGTLVLDMYGANSKRLIWRGTASDTLGKAREEREQAEQSSG